ncbi:D-alanyl-D-alanine carboxypeptidase/D-alanyl-D-alanine-endopeptidase (penicillin-binding protein 4) [Hymenobacter luteus]|uniref:D-alanyl-D-alanine carboxypeptidase/D-alanyl-D-alanine-endopeptidase (Penicillin-binding protein 4) n=2 Tax=Hymenobacter TaxID=89966 RepID=A0A7W9SWN4_9BACT|nr:MULTISPECIES: D-alanyl-D-alanine carboxypeptidase [Hymenobacter]MBB4600440.1 D-alanyl-D-alanine carboxypeptidase/D-alanyl-D-alanine-endopeptidase (penicillin-binding protein 4) [Hymenobacter latericoloratus]MBB6057250.1 D-alanyl-D-alanine carboxypeptidase/D-alanyl-D-alanine-endopeptidase (penicillin-binding protein 4) [Hymenobacter luteus]
MPIAAALMSFFCFLQRAVLMLLCLSAGAVAAQTLPVATPVPAPNLPWLEQLLHESAVLGRHHVGVCLTDATTGQQLFGQHEDRYFTPASTMKLFSLYAGLRMLPDSLPALRYVLRPDTLLFWGTGDPTLLHGDVPSRRALAFLQSRPEKLVYAEVPTGTAFGPGWSWDDYNYYFQPERGAFPVYGHTVRFYAKAGQPLPRVYPRFFRPLTEAAPAGTPNLADDHVRRAQLENRFTVFPSTKNWVDETPFRTSPALLLQLLQDTLRRPVVQAPFRLRPQDAVYTLRGLPVDSLYRRMIRVSDNFLAEQLLLLCASTLSPDSLSAARVIKAMQANYLRSLPDRAIWVDGSGLSRLNLTTPRTLTALLVRLHQEVEEPRLLSLLATGGGQGTLRRRYRPVAGNPWLWGKTGTLTNNHNLVGYIRTKSGRLLAFSFFNNNIPGDDAPVRNEMERILTQVRERL